MRNEPFQGVQVQEFCSSGRKEGGMRLVCFCVWRANYYCPENQLDYRRL